MLHLLWHHLNGPKFRRVVLNGVIMPDMKVEQGHLPCVWFGRDPFWDKREGDVSGDHPTDSMYRAYRDSMVLPVRELGRIGVAPDTAPHDWSDYKQMIGKGRFDTMIPPKASRKLILCRQFSVDPVPSEKWEAVQVWQGGTWVDIPFGKSEPA
jgi:hypothetical protein